MERPVGETRTLGIWVGLNEQGMILSGSVVRRPEDEADCQAFAADGCHSVLRVPDGVTVRLGQPVTSLYGGGTWVRG